MDFFNDWRSKIVRAAKTVKDTSGDLYKTSKLNLALGSEQENLKKIYLEIGQKVHEIYQYGGNLGTFFDQKYEEIQKIEEKIEILKKQLEEYKKVKICPHCMKNMDQKATFCPHCGKKIQEITETKEVQDEIRPEVKQKSQSLEDISIQDTISEKPMEDTKICPVCKAENSPEDRFCMSCGRAIF